MNIKPTVRFRARNLDQAERVYSREPLHCPAAQLRLPGQFLVLINVWDALFTCVVSLRVITGTEKSDNAHETIS